VCLEWEPFLLSMRRGIEDYASVEKITTRPQPKARGRPPKAPPVTRKPQPPPPAPPQLHPPAINPPIILSEVIGVVPIVVPPPEPCPTAPVAIPQMVDLPPPPPRKRKISPNLGHPPPISIPQPGSLTTRSGRLSRSAPQTDFTW